MSSMLHAAPALALIAGIACSCGSDTARSALPGSGVARVVLRNPIDPRQQTSVAFGERSHWAQPWRAYLDTVPAVRLLNGVGVNFNVDAKQARATARLLARAGFR